ncbi:MAG TPA: hypothetical protein VGU71_10265 [Candidatus Dormibacteraeota bacterium]|nr:hypothetical protein [Candidatus Dormibacteraeota bacterium]
MPTVRVNGVELYYEDRGDGPPVLPIHAGGGDSGTVSKLADILAADFMSSLTTAGALSRSPRSSDWKQTSIYMNSWKTQPDC